VIPAPIRTVPQLLAELRRGGRLIRRELWELGEGNGWRQYELVKPDGTRVHVAAKIAIVADRKGLVTVGREDARPTA
jgi:hypothetical protein